MGNEEIEIGGRDDEDVEFCYGVPLPRLPEGIQSLEILVLISGIDMESGSPTATAVGSKGLTPWLGVGLMRLEQARLELSYTLTAVALDHEDDEDYD